LAARPNLSWTHYKALLVVADDKARAKLADRAAMESWGVRQLREVIERSREKEKPALVSALKEPVRGRPGICRIKETTMENGAEKKIADLGFHVYLALSEKDKMRFQPQDSVIWDVAKKAWALSKEKSDYFYSAELERTVDGDTLLLQFELGHGINRRQYIRLRGVDAPSLKTPEGKKAHQWLRKRLRKASRLEVRTHAIDLYGRYVADVWAVRDSHAPHSPVSAHGRRFWAGGVYLNQALLDAGMVSGVACPPKRRKGNT